VESVDKGRKKLKRNREVEKRRKGKLMKRGSKKCVDARTYGK
jgi:hypothetical protein